MTRATVPLPYTASPWRLILSDLLLWMRITFVLPLTAGIPSIILPIMPFGSGKLDELYPSFQNFLCLAYHGLMLLTQGSFMLSMIPAALFGIGAPFLPPLAGAYTAAWFLWVIVFVFVNKWFSVVVNGRNRTGEFFSNVKLTDEEKERTAKEQWVFVNGVACGDHWLQTALDRLSLTFRRPVSGIQNPTHGILFDLVACILQRTLSYPTASTRQVYAKLLKIVSDPKTEKVVIILHSQGAIMGGLALDWLLVTVPYEHCKKIEVYTFGSAANHFNNPVKPGLDNRGRRIDIHPAPNDRMIRHIEHYTNRHEYVSKFGILAFRPIPDQQKRRLDPFNTREEENRYFGTLFIREGSGHLLTGFVKHLPPYFLLQALTVKHSNYLDYFFPMDKNMKRVLEFNPFMESPLDAKLFYMCKIVVTEDDPLAGHRITTNGATDMRELEILSQKHQKVREVSRLWQYRNGGSPLDAAD